MRLFRGACLLPGDAPRRPAGMHLYQAGPHGVGLRPGIVPEREWSKVAEVRMRLNGRLATR